MHLKKGTFWVKKEVGKSVPVAPKRKKAENLLSLRIIDSHKPKIGLNPNFVGYSNSP